jgi:hypothetical protein
LAVPLGECHIYGGEIVSCTISRQPYSQCSHTCSCPMTSLTYLVPCKIKVAARCISEADTVMCAHSMQEGRNLGLGPWVFLKEIRFPYTNSDKTLYRWYGKRSGLANTLPQPWRMQKIFNCALDSPPVDKQRSPPQYHIWNTLSAVVASDLVQTNIGITIPHSAMSRQSIVPPSKKVQCNSWKMIQKVHHVNHTFCIDGWATF